MRSDTADPKERSPDELERDIADTRARISQNVDSLSYRLSPAGLGEDAKGAVADTQALTFGAIEGLSEKFLERTHGWSEQTREFAKRNSVPVTIVGLGLAWLLMRANRR